MQWIFMYKFLYEYVVSSLAYIPRSGPGGSWGSSMFQILRNCPAVFHSSGTILHSCQQWMRALIFPYCNQPFFCFFIIAISRGYEVVSHCGFNLYLIFLVTKMLSSVSCAYWTSVYLWRNVNSNPLPILKLGCLFCCWVIKVLFIVWILDPLSDTWFVDIFSISMGYLSICSVMSFEALKFFILMKSNFCIFSFGACAFDVISKTPLPNPKLQRFTPVYLYFLLSIL